MLNSGEAWFHEPGLDQMLARNVKAGRLRFTSRLAEAAEFGRVHFLGVATPGLPDGSYDLSQVNAAVITLARHLSGPALVVGKSTVPPGTAGERKRFSSAILPPWPRKTPQISEVLPLLYLHGLSSGTSWPPQS
jgi:UDPglucose 6-dehydrogenase